jgi:hypothetical protein
MCFVCYDLFGGFWFFFFGLGCNCNGPASNAVHWRDAGSWHSCRTY